jgi:hypothetical protein
LRPQHDTALYPELDHHLLSLDQIYFENEKGGLFALLYASCPQQYANKTAALHFVCM